MKDFLFYFFSIITIVSGMLVALSRNAVNCAMFMIVAFIGTAGLFFLLDAFFIGVLQILVYAGAVMVLFLFVIMLLNVEQAAMKKLSWCWGLLSFLGFVMLLVGIFYMFQGAPELDMKELPKVLENVSFEAPFAYTTSAKSFGYGLFTKYLLPLEVAGFLLLVAMIGIVVISKRRKSEGD